MKLMREGQMSVEVYYARLMAAPPVSLDGLAERLAASGLPCAVEPDAEGQYWLVPSGCESAVLASVAGDEVALATLHCTGSDDPTLQGRIEAVLRSAGFSADEDAEYA